MITVPAMSGMVGFGEAKAERGGRWRFQLWRWHAGTGRVARGLLAGVLTALIAVADGLAGEGLSFEGLYGLPIGYAAWFLGGRSGAAGPRCATSCGIRRRCAPC